MEPPRLTRRQLTMRRERVCPTCTRRSQYIVRGECPRCYAYRKRRGIARPVDLTFRGGPAPGPDHHQWKGDAASRGTGHARAQKAFSLGPCERCGRAGVERHHKDGNTLNNSSANVAVLCRRCHLAEDGRLDHFIAAGVPFRTKPHPPEPCATCGRPTNPLRRGECKTCRDYRLRTGRARPERLWRS